MSKFAHVLDDVDAYVHEALPMADAQRVRLHCEKCPICQAALIEAQKRAEAYQLLPGMEASESLIQATQDKIAAYQRRSRFQRATDWWRAMPSQGRFYTAAGATAACLLLTILSLHVYYATLRPSPYDMKILGQTDLLSGAESSLRVVLLDSRTDAALADVPVTIEIAQPNTQQFVHLASFRTDAQGTGSPRVQLPDWSDGDYELRVVAQPSGGEQSLTRQVRLRRDWRVMLTTDKPVYQPGQTIRMRSLSLRRPDLKPTAGQPVTFRITDPKGNVIYRKSDVTSKFGIASLDCPLAEEILTGNYRIDCQVGETASAVAVEVKKYVLPKFKTELELDKSYYQPGDLLIGTLQADYFFGKPVADAEVAIELRAVGVGEDLIEEATVRTDEAGAAQFSLRLPERLVGREQDSGDARITLQANVVDSAGQQQTKTLSRVVTTNPIQVQVIPESETLVKGLANRVYVLATYADGRPAQARLAVSGFDDEFVTSPLGVAVCELTPKSEEVTLIVRASDDQGLSGRREVTLKCGVTNDDFLVRTDKAVYDGGDVMRLSALGGGNEPIFVDFVKDGQTILTDAIEMKDGHGEYLLDLPPETFGTLELCVYRFADHGLPVRKTRVIYVRQANQLQIAAHLDRDEYRPGEQAKISLSLTDADGKPAPGAISLAAVDEAVFSVLGSGSDLQQAFFTLEDELLKPVYEIYPWNPSLNLDGSPKERALFEQAIFAGTEPRSNLAREAYLQELLPFLENNEEMLEVLQRPDWEELLDVQTYFSPEVLDLLRSQARLHTLSASSYAENVQATEQARRAGLELVKGLWLLFGVIFGLPIFAIFLTHFFSQDRLVGCVTVVIVGGILAGLLVPAVQQAREAARRAQSANELRQIAMAGEYHKDVQGADARKPQSKEANVRVRQWFPETLLWRPELITDDQGRVTIDVLLADSITTWRLTASAVSADGALGASQAPIRIFQPFFVDLDLPVALTRGDEVAIPAVVYNYLEQPQTVSLQLKPDAWFESLDDVERQLQLQPGEVRSVHFRIKAKQVGRRQLQVTARSGQISDALKRDVEIVPDGQPVERVVNGVLQPSAEIELTVPDDAIDGSVRAVVRLYPSTFSHVVEGLDAIFQRPSGCFEQTSSTTYPNVLALDYLRKTGKSVPAVETKAREYIHLGYQRLLSFEIDGGGFDWFGHPPANRTLTAYGLMEFKDMARVHDVDPLLIRRTRDWLLNERNGDGSWDPEQHRFHGDPADANRRMARLSTTAYIAWSVFDDSTAPSEARKTRDYLTSYRPEEIQDPYVLGLVCNALLTIDPHGDAADRYVTRLATLRKSTADGKQCWWDGNDRRRTMFYGDGRSKTIETTAIAALALVRGHGDPATTRGALAWLMEQKDGGGTWHSTQATVLALKALIAGTGSLSGDDKERRIEIQLAGEPDREIVIPADQADVMRQIDLSAEIQTGSRKLTLRDASGTLTGYQVAFKYHTPTKKERPTEPLAVTLEYDRTELTVNDSLTATATVENRQTAAAPMVMLDLPIPAGFAVDAADFDELVRNEKIAKYQLTSRSVILYLRGLEPAAPLALTYELTATMPVDILALPAVAYEYYDEDKRGTSLPTRLLVQAAP